MGRKRSRRAIGSFETASSSAPAATSRIDSDASVKDACANDSSNRAKDAAEAVGEDDEFGKEDFELLNVDDLDCSSSSVGRAMVIMLSHPSKRHVDILLDPTSLETSSMSKLVAILFVVHDVVSNRSSSDSFISCYSSSLSLKLGYFFYVIGERARDVRRGGRLSTDAVKRRAERILSLWLNDDCFSHQQVLGWRATSLASPSVLRAASDSVFSKNPNEYAFTSAVLKEFLHECRQNGLVPWIRRSSQRLGDLRGVSASEEFESSVDVVAHAERTDQVRTYINGCRLALEVLDVYSRPVDFCDSASSIDGEPLSEDE